MDRNKVQVIFIFGILVCILVACGGDATPDFNQPLLTPTTLAYPSVSPTITPTRYIATVTSKPDVATRQSWRSTAIAIATAERATSEQDWNNKATQMSNFSVSCDKFLLNEYVSQISPDGNWFAASCGYKRDQTLIVKNRWGVIWVVEYQNFFPAKYPGALFPVFWSPDGGYLYFSGSIGYSGGGTQCFPQHRGKYGLFQLNLNDGLWTILIPPTESFPGYEVEFSPTGRRYAISDDGITIADIKTGNIIHLNVSGLMKFSWSPDGRYLAYSLADCSESDLAQSASVYVWDSTSGQVQLLFSFVVEGQLLYPESWVDNSTLRVLAEKWVGFDNFYDVYVYDISKGDFIFSGTATPSP
jgi:dipeptidyl aminopeptidase/acylaminoacyl peptidase